MDGDKILKDYYANLAPVDEPIYILLEASRHHSYGKSWVLELLADDPQNKKFEKYYDFEFNFAFLLRDENLYHLLYTPLTLLKTLILRTSRLNKAKLVHALCLIDSQNSYPTSIPYFCLSKDYGNINLSEHLINILYTYLTNPNIIESKRASNPNYHVRLKLSLEQQKKIYIFCARFIVKLLYHHADSQDSKEYCSLIQQQKQASVQGNPYTKIHEKDANALLNSIFDDIFDVLKSEDKRTLLATEICKTIVKCNPI